MNELSSLIEQIEEGFVVSSSESNRGKNILIAGAATVVELLGFGRFMANIRNQTTSRLADRGGLPRNGSAELLQGERATLLLLPLLRQAQRFRLQIILKIHFICI